MAYNSKNLLIRIIEIQNLTLEYQKKGATQKWVYRNVVKERFHVSYGAFKQYMGRNAKNELRELEKIDSNRQ